MAESTDKPLWLDVRYIDDHVMMTTADAWTYVVLPGLATNLPTREQLNQLVRGVDAVLSGLGRETEVHYHLAYRDQVTDKWAKALTAGATKPTPAWEDYLRRMRRRMADRQYKDRVLFLGVKLGSRRSLEKPNLRGASPMQNVKAWTEALLSAAAGPDPQPSAKEVARWREVATKVRQALGASMLDAEPAKATDIAWLIQHVQRLGMPEGAPSRPGRTWGAGTIHDLAEAVVDNSDPTQLTLKITGRNAQLDVHMEGHNRFSKKAAQLGVPAPPMPAIAHESHVAVLPIGQLPDVTADPWLFHASAMNFPVEVSARLRIQSPEQAEKDAAVAARNQRNTIKDNLDSGVEVHGKDARRFGGASALHQEQASGDGRRQIVATYRLLVAGSSRELVGARAEEVIRHFREDNGLGVTVEWPPGDQLVLWQELLPGQLKRTRLYEQRQDLVTFAVGLPFSVSIAGDGEGPYIGSIETGNPAPVLYDMATAAKRGKAPTLALTGTLGGGKTFFTLTLMDHFRLRGYPVIALDPKGDIKGHLLLRGRGDARFFDLSNDGMPGSLDPFTLVPAGVDPNDPDRSTPELADARWREETRALVMDVMNQLLHGATHEKMAAAVAMTLNYEMTLPRPTMWHFLQQLEVGGVNPPAAANIDPQTASEYRMAAISAHAQLKNASESQLGRLMFAPQSANSAALFQGGVATTIVSLSGLDLPKDGLPPSSPAQRFSVALFSLVAHQARRMLQDLDYVGPRALIIDEAHQITSLPSGRSLIVSNGRMGRSRDIAMLLATQSAADLTGPDLRNVISAVFAFRTNEREEREDIAKLLGRAPDDEAIHAMLPTDQDPAGQCLFLDLNKNVSLIRIDRWAEEYDVAFDTNPTRQSVSAAGTRIVTDQFGVVIDPESVGPRGAASVLAGPAPTALPAAAPVQAPVATPVETVPVQGGYTGPVAHYPVPGAPTAPAVYPTHSQHGAGAPFAPAAPAPAHPFEPVQQPFAPWEPAPAPVPVAPVTAPTAPAPASAAQNTEGWWD